MNNCPHHPQSHMNTPQKDEQDSSHSKEPHSSMDMSGMKNCPMHAMGTMPSMPPSTQSPDNSGATYTCPMHSQIKQDHPGTCPICGMALEQEIPSAQLEKDTELSDFKKRFFITLPFSLLLFILGMGQHLFGNLMSSSLNWIQLLLSLPVVLWAGAPLFARGWKSIITRNPNMWTLIILGTSVAFLYSLVATFFPEIFPENFLHAGHLAVYFEASALIISLSLLGQIFELKARSRTSDAIRSLLDLSPSMARIILPDKTEKDIPITEVHLGDKLRVRPGEKVPVDGTILDGSGDLNESMITGEYSSVAKNPGQTVIGGTLNATGSFIMVANHVGKDTILAKIVALVAQAQRSQAPIQRMVDVVSKYFVITVISLALITFILWGFLGPSPSWDYALINAVSVLIVACPCALGLATPMSVMVASGKAATMGVLFRDAAAMEALSKIDTLVLDKTGTLTEGKPEFDNIFFLSETNDNQILTYAAALERGSEHPLSLAIVNEAEKRGLPRPPVSEFKAWPGGGVSGTIEEKNMVLGTAALCAQLGGDTTPLAEKASSLRREGKGTIFILQDNIPVGIISVKDKIKEDAASTLSTLKQLGIHIIVASGDAQETVNSLAKELSIDDARGEMTPEMKLSLIKTLRENSHNVGMAGDGINDAPALAESNIGIAMGTGTDIAMQSSSVTLVKGDLKGIKRAYTLSCATMQNMRSNLWLAFAYNALGIPLAAGILYPHFGILMSPVFAAAAMSLSSVSVILNALRLRKFDAK